MDFESADILAADATVNALLKPLLSVLEGAVGATELCVNRPGEAFVQVGADWRRIAVPGMTLERCLSLATAIATFTEQEIGPSKPILSAKLPGGERIQILVPPAVEQDAISMTIRIPPRAIKDLREYEADGAFGRFVWAEAAGFEARKASLGESDRRLCELLAERKLREFFERAVLAKKTIAVVGDTGSGKTTLMKALCQHIPERERLLTIEDVRELLLPHHPNRVHMLYSKGRQGVADITPADLIASCMRQKPDRILLAELRGSEAFDFLKLLTTGHNGSITSFHAESCALAADRFVFMCKEHEQAAIYDTAALKRLVTLTIDVVVHVVAHSVDGGTGTPARMERYVAEVQFDPVAKLATRFGDAVVHS